MTDDLDDDLLEPSSFDSARPTKRDVPRPPGKGPAKPLGRHFRPRARETKPEPVENFYPDVYAFVWDFLAPLFAHEVHDQLRTFRWCAHWFLHTEALARLEALWKAWEVLRLDPGTGASVWFRDYADPCLAALTGPEGPFRQCSDTKHKAAAVLPLAPLPAGLSLRYQKSRTNDGPADAEVEQTVQLLV